MPGSFDDAVGAFPEANGLTARLSQPLSISSTVWWCLAIGYVLSGAVLAASMHAFARQSVGLVAGVFAIHAYFRVLESRWPDSYFEFESATDPIVSRSFTRYAIFRLAPVYIVCLFVSVTLQRSGAVAWWVVLAIAVVHLALTTGRGLVGVLDGSTPSAAAAGRIAYHVFACIGVLSVAIASLAFHDQLGALIPRPHALISGLWIALIAGFSGAFLIARMAAPRMGDAIGPEILRSNVEIGPYLMAHAKRECVANDVQWEIFHAILSVENMQRPSWVRSAERLVGRISGRPGSFGIMQVQSEAPISDEESISLAARRLAGVHVKWNPPSYAGAQGSWDWEGVRSCAASYNPDGRYVALVEKVFFCASADPRELLP